MLGLFIRVNNINVRIMQYNVLIICIDQDTYLRIGESSPYSTYSRGCADKITNIVTTNEEYFHCPRPMTFISLMTSAIFSALLS